MESIAELRAEIARLTALLEAHGIDWRQPTSPGNAPPADAPPGTLSAAEKIALFSRLFRGRTDVYAVRWESRTSGKSGYSPACENEWQPGVCEKPRVRCSECVNRAFRPLTDAVLYAHLAGKETIGVYPLLPDDTCWFVATDFDAGEWREDARGFMTSCKALGVPAALEVSRSGNGAHAWIFFAAPVPAREARRLASAIITHTCARVRQLALTSYDRLFPNQDTTPGGGFGNLIALPLQKRPRERGASVFVGDDFRPFDDQWAFLASITPMSPRAIDAAILRATGGGHALDVGFISEEDQAEPWKRPGPRSPTIPGPLPRSLAITLADRLYLDKEPLTQPLLNRLVRLAAFQNPEFFKAQAMRLPVWNKPRVIGCAENFPEHVALPRGCLEAVRDLLTENGIGWDLKDERHDGEPVSVSFAGELRPDQETAVAAMLPHETGVLSAPTAFGKTVIAAALIARRGISTLVLVHRTELLEQWRERLHAFLGVAADIVGTIGGGKRRPTGRIDIAVMRSLSRGGEVDALVDDYGQVIVDECHHVSAVSVEAILKRVRARFVLGLTATPIRRDGQHPIIFMQCGPLRHAAHRPAGAPRELLVTPRLVHRPVSVAAQAGIQEVFRRIAHDDARTAAIATAISEAFGDGRKILVLTERTEHLDAILGALDRETLAPYVLHGRMSRKLRGAVVSQLDALPPEAPRVLLATGRLVGEGFDHPPLDTLVLAMPISWKGTLQQYAGRLHREHAAKREVRIVDFVDTGHPALMRMWERRQRGYRAMGYRIDDRGGRAGLP